MKNRDNSNLGNFQSNLEFLIENKLIKETDKILEIGSGKGYLLSVLLKRGFQIVGVEKYDEFFNEAKEKYGKDFPLEKVEDKRLPFEDNSFDKVISFDVLEHIPDTDSHLKEVYRVLKYNGEYCFGIPNRLVDEPFCLLTYRNFNYRKQGDHCSLHTYGQIRRRLKKNGFSVIFYRQNQNTDWFKGKVEKFFGKFGLAFLKITDIDKWPIWLKPTLYIRAEKIKNSGE